MADENSRPAPLGVSVRLLSPGARDCVEPAQRKAGQQAGSGAAVRGHGPSHCWGCVLGRHPLCAWRLAGADGGAEGAQCLVQGGGCVAGDLALGLVLVVGLDKLRVLLLDLLWLL